MIVALASPAAATTVDEGLSKVERLAGEASARGAAIVCFPEAYLPGLRGQDFVVPPWDERQQERALENVARAAEKHAIAVVLGIERVTAEGRQIGAVVLDASGRIQGWQTKNQLDPSEDGFYVPGRGRRIFEVDGVRFGIAICHEGWRYPETVRWAAARGARIVFHPQHTGSNTVGSVPTRWGEPEAPYYEKAMMCRGLENTIYFGSVNYALRYPDSATSLITPSGRCQAYLPYGEEGVLVERIDVEQATGLLAGRYAPERHGEIRVD